MLFRSELKIEPAKGKTFYVSDSLIKEIKNLPEIDIFAEVLEETALLKYGERQLPAILKSVSSNYNELTSIDSIILNVRFILSDSIVNYATIGVGLAGQIGIRAGFVRPLEVSVPKAKKKLNILKPQEALSTGLLFAGGEFIVNQAKYDDNLLIAPIEFARELFGEPDMVSSIELKLKKGVNIDRFEKHLQNILGNKYKVLNRYEQQADSFKIMQMEKLFSYIMLIFILIIASFNIIGSLSMLIIEKKDDIKTLKNLGANDGLIKRIFYIEGFLISISDRKAHV